MRPAVTRVAAVLLEGTVERGALAAVERQHRSILRHAGECACDDALRYAGAPPPRANIAAKKGAEIAAALRCARGRGKEQRAQESREGRVSIGAIRLSRSAVKRDDSPPVWQVTRIIAASKWHWASPRPLRKPA